MTKDLKAQAITFKGKQYVQVKDRISFFNETYPNGAITTELLTPAESNIVVFKAIVWPDTKNQERFFTGYSQAKWDDKLSYINKSSAMENAETSAVGRALAMLGIGIIDSIASKEEVVKSINQAPKENAFTKVYKCEKCGAVISPKVADYSWRAYGGQELCLSCQKKENLKTMPPKMAKIVNQQVTEKYHLGDELDDTQIAIAGGEEK